MFYTMERILRKYGSAMTLIRGGKAMPFRGFLQHSGSKSWQNMRAGYCPAGRIPSGQYVLLAPMLPEVAEGDTLICGDRKVVVQNIETVMAGDTPLYRWGLCVRKGGEESWA